MAKKEKTPLQKEYEKQLKRIKQIAQREKAKGNIVDISDLVKRKNIITEYDIAFLSYYTPQKIREEKTVFKSQQEDVKQEDTDFNSFEDDEATYISDRLYDTLVAILGGAINHLTSDYLLGIFFENIDKYGEEEYLEEISHLEDYLLDEAGKVAYESDPVEVINAANSILYVITLKNPTDAQLRTIQNLAYEDGHILGAKKRNKKRF